MRIAILAPSNVSLYARVVLRLLQDDPQIEFAGILSRRVWNLRRMRGEWRRDGARLVRKVYTKLVARDWGAGGGSGPTLPSYAAELGDVARDLSTFASEKKIPYLSTVDFNSPEALQNLRDWRPDVIIFTGGGLLRDELLSIPTLGTLNCHMGLLPEFRGMDVVEWPLLTDAAAPRIGLTVHLMDSGIDTGPILQTLAIPLHAGESRDALRARFEIDMSRTMAEVVGKLAREEITAKTQRLEDGKQYFVMHPRLTAIAAMSLEG